MSRTMVILSPGLYVAKKDDPFWEPGVPRPLYTVLSVARLPTDAFAARGNFAWYNVVTDGTVRQKFLSPDTVMRIDE